MKLQFYQTRVFLKQTEYRKFRFIMIMKYYLIGESSTDIFHSIILSFQKNKVVFSKLEFKYKLFMLLKK